MGRKAREITSMHGFADSTGASKAKNAAGRSAVLEFLRPVEHFGLQFKEGLGFLPSVKVTMRRA